MTTKICSQCGLNKALSEFHAHKRHGFQSHCKKCGNELSKAYYRKNRKARLEYARSARRTDPDRFAKASRNARIRREYGMEPEDFDRLVESQNGACAICSTVPEKWLCVDHSHTTGEVRGLLCDHCNRGLGFLKDDPNLLRNALAYLQ